MNVRRIPALFALVFAASACSPSLVMLRVRAAGAGYRVRRRARRVDGRRRMQPAVPPVDAPTYAVSTAGAGPTQRPRR